MFDISNLPMKKQKEDHDSTPIENMWVTRKEDRGISVGNPNPDDIVDGSFSPNDIHCEHAAIGINRYHQIKQKQSFGNSSSDTNEAGVKSENISPYEQKQNMKNIRTMISEYESNIESIVNQKNEIQHKINEVYPGIDSFKELPILNYSPSMAHKFGDIVKIEIENIFMYGYFIRQIEDENRITVYISGDRIMSVAKKKC